MKEIMEKQGMNHPNAALPFDPEKYGCKDGVNAPAIPFSH